MKVAVLGAGAAGLAAAVELRRAGAEVAIFEADLRVGGKLRSAHGDGYLCEDGANSLTAQSVVARRFADEAKLAVLEARPPHTRFVVRHGERLAAPSRRLLSAAGWARLAAEPLAALQRGGPDESVAGFFERHLGPEAGALAATLLANGVYGGDPRLLSVQDAFPRTAGLERVARSLFVAGAKRAFQAHRGKSPGMRSLWSLAKGISALPEALAERVWDALHLASPVERLSLTAANGHAQGFLLHVGGKRPSDLSVDGVVCALPASAAARLLSPVARGAEALAQVRSAPLVVVHLGFHAEDVPQRPAGFGVLDGDGSLDVLGVLFPSSLFAGRAPDGQVLFTCMLGGVLHAEIAAFDDAALGFLARAALRRLFGVERPPAFTRIARWPEAVPQPNIGHAARIAKVRSALSALPIELAGAAFDGVSVEQVLVSGTQAAERLLARLRAGAPAVQKRPAESARAEI